MEKKRYEISIHASPEKVWQTLWDLSRYQAWTSVFAEGSTVETDDWREGSRVLFLDGKGNGMVSEVAANRPNELMSFRHLGTVKDGIQDLDSEETRKWAGAKEDYHLAADNGKTRLTVEMDITDDFLEYFENTWPKALARIKELAETN
ncbi:MAG TPA: SRPBCC domain-containing protein [Chitinophagaceae bacterium]|nr:SRPBCC domain-containing protein [Chitinophagaceae bacterium]